MAESSGISWTDATFNGWIGCTKISPACDGCYAEADNNRRKWVDGWGPGVPRRRTSASYWKQPLRWQRKYREGVEDFETGMLIRPPHRPRVFCASLADVFDNEVPQAWRDDLFALIRSTPDLRWLLLSKRIGNAPKMLPADWDSGAYRHVGLMSTLENQEVWDRDYRKLKAIPAAWHGVSAEPLLGPIDMQVMIAHFGKIDWMITGGESGPNRRPLDMNAVRSIRDQCAHHGITFHHKQNGGLRGKDTGCLVDGVEHKHFPAALAA